MAWCALLAYFLFAYFATCVIVCVASLPVWGNRHGQFAIAIAVRHGHGVEAVLVVAVLLQLYPLLQSWARILGRSPRREFEMPSVLACKAHIKKNLEQKGSLVAHVLGFQLQLQGCSSQITNRGERRNRGVLKQAGMPWKLKKVGN